MQWPTLVLFASLTPSAHALLRYWCSQLVTQRIDPISHPGAIAPHVLQVSGGNAFNATIDPKLDLYEQSTCTTCKFKEDASNYITPVLYFKHENGSYFRVPQFPVQFTGQPDGGVTVYYVQPTNTTRLVSAFPKGFRMVSGDPDRRSPGDAPTDAPKPISFRCWDANYTDPSADYPYPGTGPDSASFPTVPCAGGIRSQIFFPSCWNGKELDSENHSSHMVYPVNDVPRDGHLFLQEKSFCPSSHPVRTPMLYFEVAWNTTIFNDMWPSDGSQPFVFSQGDPTGYGQYGAFIAGWKEGALQRAMNTCTDFAGNFCKELTEQRQSEANLCKQEPSVDEVVEGEWLPTLPGQTA